jgi:hypothetical protein
MASCDGEVIADHTEQWLAADKLLGYRIDIADVCNGRSVDKVEARLEASRATGSTTKCAGIRQYLVIQSPTLDRLPLLAHLKFAI